MNSEVSSLPFVEDVETLGPKDTVLKAISVFKEKKIGSIVVVDDSKKVVGIFTERDVVNKVSGKEDLVLQEPIETFMTSNPKSVKATDPVVKAAVLMRMGRFRHVVVKNEDGSLKGIISIKDVLDWFIDNMDIQK